MKTEKDKLEELEDLLADVSFSGDETDESDDYKEGLQFEFFSDVTRSQSDAS